jgi:hypothetical protein
MKECDSPLYLPIVTNYQKQGKKLKVSMLKTSTAHYTSNRIEGVELIHYLDNI